MIKRSGLLNRPFIFTILLFIGKITYAVAAPNPGFCDTAYTNPIIIPLSDNEVFIESGDARPSPILQRIRSKQRKNRKITATLLALPLPFGIVGLHRIYLGSAPYVPVVYIATLGGAFGILPLIDFFVLVLEKDIDRFNNNDKVFMWVR